MKQDPWDDQQAVVSAREKRAADLLRKHGVDPFCVERSGWSIRFDGKPRLVAQLAVTLTDTEANYIINGEKGGSDE
jgi:hypothetical protein